MGLSRDEVRAHVLQSLHEVLGEENAVDINDQTDPIRGLGLNSDDGLDFACALSEKLNYDIPDKVNPLVDDSRRRPRRVGEIVDLMCKLLTIEQEENHG